MSIDKQRVSAVSILERLGYRWTGTAWDAPGGTAPASIESAADQMHGVLMDRAEKLAGCVEDSEGETELEAIGEALEAYERARWPTGRVEPPQR